MSAYGRILVAVDGSDVGAAGLREALRLAKREGAELCILHVVNESIPYTPLAGAPPMNLIALLQDSGRRILEEARAQAQKAGVRASTVLLESADRTAAGGIVSQARKQHAELIVLGTHGRRGVRRLVLGSDAEQVVRTAPAPVLVVRGAAAVGIAQMQGARLLKRDAACARSPEACGARRRRRRAAPRGGLRRARG